MGKKDELNYALDKAINEQHFSADVNPVKDALNRTLIAREVLEYLDSTYKDRSQKDSETSLLRGYLELPKCELPDNDYGVQHYIERYKKALTYFKSACYYPDGFRVSIAAKTIQNNKIIDESSKRHEVEKVSAYLITVIRLWRLTRGREKMSDEYEDCTKQLTRFLSGMTKLVEISLKAAIALAEWLLEYTDLVKDRKETDALFRSFNYVTIYKERGANVFNHLKEHPDFRLLQTHDRGEILALLLAMYKPIKALKEECAYTLDDKRNLQRMNEEDPGRRFGLAHYTSLNTLKILLKKETSAGGKAAEKPRFRINNCGYMNDVFEGSVFLRCLKEVALIEDEAMRKKQNQTIAAEKRNWTPEAEADYNKMLYKFFPYLNQTETDRKPVASDVYIGSLSIKTDSFPIWDSYADKEKGCNISFGEDYFDVTGPTYYPHTLREYMISNKTDESYPLYIVQYIESEKAFKQHIDKYLKDNLHLPGRQAPDQWDIRCTGSRIQHCGTEVIEYTDLCRLLRHIYLRWKQLSGRLDKMEEKQGPYLINLARQFAADRLNEIRFLFKDADYEFEAEVRVVHTETEQSSLMSGIDFDRDIPTPYTNIKRDLTGLTIRLGSKIIDSEIDKNVTWLKQTGQVDTVILSTRNRYILRTMK